MIKPLLLSSVLGALAAGGAVAATVSYDEATEGDISNAWWAPTEIGNGYDLVTGTRSSWIDSEYLHFGGLTAGAQTLTFTIRAPERAGWFFAAGGAILYGETPFRWSWDGQQVPGGLRIGYWRPEQSVDVTLGSDFGGSLYVAMNFTHGADFSWSILAPGNAEPLESIAGRDVSLTAIPLPGGLWLALGGLGLLAPLAARRSART